MVELLMISHLILGNISCLITPLLRNLFLEFNKEEKINNLVHGPTIEFFVRKDLQGDAVLITVPFDSLKTVVSIS
jgi:hypothetical protein